MNKMFLALGIASVLAYSVPTMPTKAVSNETVTTVSAEIQPRTEGLITGYDLSVSSGTKTIYINGKTASNDTMKSIGYKDIYVQYSSDGVNWQNEKSIDELLKSDSTSYYLDNYAVSVNGGYYYRITCKHYAKKKGWFGSSQSVDNTSNSVWVSK